MTRTYSQMNRTDNYLEGSQTFGQFGKMVEVAVTQTLNFAPCSSVELLDIQTAIEFGFILKRVHDMMRRYSQLHHTYRY